MDMAMNKGMWCARGRGMLVDLGVTGEAADRVPEGRLWGPREGSPQYSLDFWLGESHEGLWWCL